MFYTSHCNLCDLLLIGFFVRIKKSGSTLETMTLFCLIGFGLIRRKPIRLETILSLPKLEISDNWPRRKFESSAYPK